MTDKAVTTIQAWQTSDSDENGGRFRYNFNLYEYTKLQITTLTSQIMVKITVKSSLIHSTYAGVDPSRLETDSEVKIG